MDIRGDVNFIIFSSQTRLSDLKGDWIHVRTFKSGCYMQ